MIPPPKSTLTDWAVTAARAALAIVGCLVPRATRVLEVAAAVAVAILLGRKARRRAAPLGWLD